MSQLNRSSRRARGGGSSDSVAVAAILYIFYLIPSINWIAPAVALFLQSSTNPLTATHSAFMVRLFLVMLLYFVGIAFAIFLLPEAAALVMGVALVLWFYVRIIMGMVALFQQKEHTGFRWL